MIRYALQLEAADGRLFLVQFMSLIAHLCVLARNRRWSYSLGPLHLFCMSSASRVSEAPAFIPVFIPFRFQATQTKELLVTKKAPESKRSSSSAEEDSTREEESEDSGNIASQDH